jgi:hypothetical protein
MSDLEIGKAEISMGVIGPRRWMELCDAFEKQLLNDLFT